jgi:hypothetical protein
VCQGSDFSMSLPSLVLIITTQMVWFWSAFCLGLVMLKGFLCVDDGHFYIFSGETCNVVLCQLKKIMFCLLTLSDTWFANLFPSSVGWFCMLDGSPLTSKSF